MNFLVVTHNYKKFGKFVYLLIEYSLPLEDETKLNESRRILSYNYSTNQNKISNDSISTKNKDNFELENWR